MVKVLTILYYDRFFLDQTYFYCVWRAFEANIDACLAEMQVLTTPIEIGSHYIIIIFATSD